MPFDKHLTPGPDDFPAFGVLDAVQALKNLALIESALGAGGLASLLPHVLTALSNAADPDMALNNLERFMSALADAPQFASVCQERRDLIGSLVTIFGASRFLSTFLITNADASMDIMPGPGQLARPADRALSAARLADMLKEATDDPGFFRILRTFRKQEMLRIGLRDLLARADLQEVVSELSDLAEICLQQAYVWADAALEKRYGRPMVEGPDGAMSRAGFGVIAMGKLGGRELNFSSDVDLMYVYTMDGETEGAAQADGSSVNRITNHQYFVKLAEKISAAIGEKTGDGFVFRVDLRLRPEGQQGPLAQSLSGYELYYESWGQTWERSALIKARPVAGDEAVGREFLERITPFVYRKYLDYSAIAEIGDMKQKINKDVEQKGRTRRDVKLGYGGIREIEFVVQALQLIYAGRDRALREKNALKALHILSQKGLITFQEHAALAKAYVFLRTVEHRIQILDDLQTQTMPSEKPELRTLARRSGYLEQGREAEQLLCDHTRHTDTVRAIYDDLFAFTGDQKEREGQDAGSDLLLDPVTTEQDAVAFFREHGFRDPEKAYRNLLLLREGPAFVHQTPRSRKLFQEIFPSLFREIAASPDPDMALNHLESFLASQGSWETLQSLVKLDAEATKVLVAVFANSAYLSRMLIGRPEYLQNLLESRKHSRAGTMAVFKRELDETMVKAADLSGKLDALRRFKHLEEIRIGMGDLISHMPLIAVCRDLSKLAEVCLAAALGLAFAETAKRYQGPESSTGLVIIGAGKLGGRELTYASDLDIMFVFSEDRAPHLITGMTAFEYFSKVAEKTISYLSTLTREGFVFRVDTRLRPTGSKGPLVQSIDAFKGYYSGQAETWELQALLRARCVAGDREVGSLFMSTISDLIYQVRDRQALRRDILAMRKRMEEELGRESAAHYNIKQGAGGLVDIEFLVQFYQLLHGKQYPRVRVPGTYNALHALERSGLLDHADYQVLNRAYLFIRQIESRLRIVSNQSSSDLDKAPAVLHALAQRMGYREEGDRAGEKLLGDYAVLSGKVRAIFNNIIRENNSMAS